MSVPFFRLNIKEGVLEEMINIREFIIQAKDLIELATDYFYQQNNDEGYNYLNKLINILIEITNEISNLKSKELSVGIEDKQLLSTLSEALEALEKKDFILLSDILNYDMNELLDAILEVI